MFFYLKLLKKLKIKKTDESSFVEIQFIISYLLENENNLYLKIRSYVGNIWKYN